MYINVLFTFSSSRLSRRCKINNYIAGKKIIFKTLFKLFHKIAVSPFLVHYILQEMTTWLFICCKTKLTNFLKRKYLSL